MLGGTDHLYTVISGALGLAAAGSCWVVWRSWRDPDNWRIDVERRKIAYNNRKEQALSMMAAMGMIGLFLAWSS